MPVLTGVECSGQQRDRAEHDQEEEAADHLVWLLSCPPRRSAHALCFCHPMMMSAHVSARSVNAVNHCRGVPAKVTGGFACTVRPHRRKHKSSPCKPTSPTDTTSEQRPSSGPAHERNTPRASRLLEAQLVERLDTGAKSPAGRANQKVEAAGKVHLSNKPSR